MPKFKSVWMQCNSTETHIIFTTLITIYSTSFDKIYNLFFWDMKVWNYQFESQVACTGNIDYPLYLQQLIEWQINILSITVLHCNTYFACKTLIKFCFILWKASYQQKSKLCHFCAIAVDEFSKCLGVWVSMDAIQHEAHNEIDGIDAFYYH